MKPRLDYYKAAPQTIDAVSALAESLKESFPDKKLKALVELRVSQINGCAYCVDLHSTQARALGETAQRLDCLVVWREVPFFTDRERAAFAWAEAITLLADTHAPDAVFAEAAAVFAPAELVLLTAVVGTMNLWNRISVGFRGLPPARSA